MEIAIQAKKNKAFNKILRYPVVNEPENVFCLIVETKDQLWNIIYLRLLMFRFYSDERDALYSSSKWM